jgi:recombination protein RecA
MAKKKQEEPIGKSKFDLAVEKLEKMYGKGTLLTLDSKIDGEYDVISSGSIGFDWITLGVGGFIKGRMYELMGWESTGKSTICAHAVAECQKKGGNVVYIDSEHSLDKKYFKNIGVDTSSLYISQPNYGEEGFNTALEMIKTGDVDLVIIDSDSSLIPKIVEEGGIGESAIGKKARLNNDAYQKLKTALVESKTCVIAVSQYREKIGLLFGNPTTTQGGHALKYYADCRIEVSKTNAKEGDVVYGNITKIKVTKNRTFPPYRNCQFEIVYGIGIDKVAELMEIGEQYGVIEKSGSWHSYGSMTLGQDKAAINLLKGNSALFNDIKASIINKIRNVEIPVEKEEEVEQY